MTGAELIVVGIAVVVIWWATLALAVWIGWRIAVDTYRRNPAVSTYIHTVLGEALNRIAGEPPRGYRG